MWIKPYSCSVLATFFFQAEDGIRDLTVTGIQTCALPISLFQTLVRPGHHDVWPPHSHWAAGRLPHWHAAAHQPRRRPPQAFSTHNEENRQIGRASCRERV